MLFILLLISYGSRRVVGALLCRPVNTACFPWCGVCRGYEEEISQGAQMPGVRQRDDQTRQERLGRPTMALRHMRAHFHGAQGRQGAPVPAGRVPRLAARGRAPAPAA